MRWLAIASLVVATLIAAWVWWPRGRAFTLPDGGSTRDNVLLVTIDTLRADALSSYGGQAQTPNLDGLAAHGARFTFAHAHAVMTLVSHTSILSGRLPFEHGVRDNAGFRVAEGTPTAATRLKAAGFTTGAFIAGFPLTKRFGLTPGFDVYDDQIPEMQGAAVFAMPERPADAVVARAGAWIDRQDGRFFGWVHLFDPHAPYRPPADDAARYAAQPYFGEVAFVDRMLGRLFDRLRARPQPTVVVVTGDHGESLGDHGEQTHGMFAYESTLRVPLIIARIVPGRTADVERGVVIDAAVQHIDILPTLLDVAGVAADASLPGASLRNMIRDGRGADRPTYFEALSFNLTRGWAPLRGLIDGRQKFIDLPLTELYDLTADSAEQRNIVESQPDRVRVLAASLKLLNSAAPNRPAAEPAAVSSALRSLGYVSGRAPTRDTYTAADDPKTLADVDRDLHTAQSLYERHQTGDAIAMLRRALERQPRMADAYTYLAYVYWETGQPALAVQTLESALSRGVLDRDIRVRLALYLSEGGGDPQRAIALLEDLPPDDVEVLNGLGIAYGTAGRNADAVKAFRRILALDPTNGLALQNIGSIRLREALAVANPADPRRAAALSDAEATLRQALDADPALPGAHTALGVLLANTGRGREAIDRWVRAVQLDPGEFAALYNLVIELAKAGRQDEASAYARQYVATAPPAFFGREIAEIRKFIRG